ncbi:MAG: helix-turn-helix domain-containing protein [bacterium]|nr:helix-turn-helix domain-containing protein [bacterium]
MAAKYELIKYPNEMHLLLYKMNYIKATTHWHTELELLFILSGSLNLTIDGKNYLLKEQEFAIINSGQIHSCESDAKQEGCLVLLQINEQFFHNLHIEIKKTRYPNIFSSLPDSEFYQKASHDILKTASELSSLPDTNREDYKTSIHLLCCNIIASLTPYSTSDEQTVSGQNTFFNSVSRIKHILSYIEAHYTEDLSVTNIAEIEHLSVYYLSHCLKKFTTTTFSQYLNYYRIRKIRYDLINTDDPITDIYLRHGYSNSKTFNRIFKEICGCSPSTFRKNDSSLHSDLLLDLRETIDTGIGTYINYHHEPYDSSLKFLIADKKTEAFSHYPDAATAINIRLSYNDPVVSYEKYYLQMTGTGRAHDLLKARLQEQFQLVQKEIGFSYIRFFGIFNKEMDVVRMQNEQPVYNFYHTDEILDCIIEQHCRPYITLGFTPDAFRSGDTTLYFYAANTTPPKSLSLWEDLIRNFVEHIIERYSLEEVLTWTFEVWNEPDINFWDGAFEQYLHLYESTVRTIKSIHANLTVGGPALSSFVFEDHSHLSAFLQFCSLRQLPIDFISLHPYPVQMKMNHDTKKLQQILLQENSLYKNITDIQDYLQSTDYAAVPLHLNEWNSTPIIRDYIHDTAFMAVFIIQNTLSNLNRVHNLCYWCLSDLIDEDGIPSKEFCGSFGLLSRSGLKKPAFFAFWALASLSGQTLSHGSNYIITKEDNRICVLLWNYCHYNQQFAQGDNSMLTYYDRYQVFDQTQNKQFHILIDDIDATHCEITTHLFDREHGSIYDFWLNNGAPEYFSHAKLQFFKAHNHLSETIEYRTIDHHTLTLSATVAPFGFTLFEIVNLTN